MCKCIATRQLKVLHLPPVHLEKLHLSVRKLTVGFHLCRTLVRSRLFWVRGLSNAWHSRDGVSDELVDAYRLPQLVRGWEIGLVRFVRARVAGNPFSPALFFALVLAFCFCWLVA